MLKMDQLLASYTWVGGWVGGCTKYNKLEQKPKPLLPPHPDPQKTDEGRVHPGGQQGSRGIELNRGPGARSTSWQGWWHGIKA